MYGDNPAQGLLDRYKQVAGGVSNFLGGLPTPPPPQPAQDTSWHDQMVQKANDGFRDQQAAPKLHEMAKPLKGK
jgi:hypothetical protein